MQKLVFNVYKFIIFILFLQSLNAWFLWKTQFFVLLLAALISVLYLLIDKTKLTVNLRTLIPITLLLILHFYTIIGAGFGSYLLALIKVFIISVVFLLEDEKKTQILGFITFNFSILLIISIFGYILFHIGVPLLGPSYLSFNEGQYVFDNYYFFLKLNRQLFSIFPRFSSVFLEPGHLGMFSALLLYANRFEIRRPSVFIIFIASLITFSLVSYVLILLSASALIILNSKRPYVYFGILFAVIIILYLFFLNYKGGDNIFYQLVIHRLEFDEGQMTGFNRFTGDFEAYYDAFIGTPRSIFGIGMNEYNKLVWWGGNAGYKVYILKYGFIGITLVFLFYISLTLDKLSKTTFIFFIIYILAFIQRSYPLWECQLLIFITSLPLLSSVKYRDK